MSGKNFMTPKAASGIQSSQAKKGGDMSSSGFAARGQAAGARNANNNPALGGNKNTQINNNKNNGGQGNMGKK